MATPTTTTSTAALFNALAWIEAKKNDAQVDTENVEVGVQCLRCVRSSRCHCVMSSSCLLFSPTT